MGPSGSNTSNDAYIDNFANQMGNPYQNNNSFKHKSIGQKPLPLNLKNKNQMARLNNLHMQQSNENFDRDSVKSSDVSRNDEKSAR